MKKIFLITIILLFIFSSCTSISKENKIDLNDLKGLTNEYLIPVAYAGITSYTWNNLEEIESDSLGLFYVAKATEIDKEAPEIWDDVPIDGEKVEKFIQNYFNVSSDFIRASNYYNEKNNSYTFESLGGAASFRVTKAEMDPNDASILILSYEYYSPADDTTVIRTGSISVKLQEDSYKYLSVSTTDIS